MEKNKKSVLVALCVTTFVSVFALAGCGVNSGEKEVGNSSGEKQMENTVTQESQSLGLTGVANARQLGGYITTDGKKIKDGVLLRTGQLSAATSDDITALTDKFQLTEVIDLRTTAEIEAALDPAIEGVTEERIPIIDESGSAYAVMTAGYTGDPIDHAIAQVENGTISDTMYSDLVMDTYGQNAYHEFFQKLLAHKDGAFLFHCAGGKDRTGVAAVLLLSALGVDRNTIMEDFILTNDFNAKNIAYVVSAAEKKTSDVKILEGVKAAVGADPNYMEKMFEAIDEKYGSMDVFLKEEIGLTDKDIAKLKDRYLE
ncbi:tyrosine-protein phosphatase [Acetobacterium sp.]|uniref:tyrosine-protein phosphatase n=1 Tax=Acetobacterium sp. TaxID=1872094 RepID=UPI00272820AF|nr:tyrosine-protein phosphatase [Acetobacterium sp.]MDO9491028.1 tyrosine-protein phosphatase [Acetobacterium sp.]